MTNKEPDDAKFPVKALNVVEVENPIIVENDKSSLSLVCSDEDDEVSCYDNDITTHSPQPIVNVVNCSDVVIGSVTQYHGPVTIVQHAHSPRLTGAIKEKETDKNNEAKLVTAEDLTPDSVHVESCIPKRIMICFICLSFLAVIISLNWIFATDATIIEAGVNGTEKDYEIPGHIYVTRSMWGARDPLDMIPMTYPAEYVIISHTAWIQCKTIQECSKNMQSIQNIHVSEQNLPDIGYNFVIGGDGNVYVGCGWIARNKHEDHSLGIAFTGNYIYDNVTDNMKDALEKLLELGVKVGTLSPDYKIVGHNQTAATISPGRNLYSYIETLTHFYPNRTI